MTVVIGGVLMFVEVVLPPWIAESLPYVETAVSPEQTVTRPSYWADVAFHIGYAGVPLIVLTIIVLLRTGVISSTLLSTAAFWLLVTYIQLAGLGDAYDGGVQAFGIACNSCGGSLVIGPPLGIVLGLWNNNRWSNQHGEQ